jgi:hypothetical protein
MTAKWKGISQGHRPANVIHNGPPKPKPKISEASHRIQMCGRLVTVRPADATEKGMQKGRGR